MLWRLSAVAVLYGLAIGSLVAGALTVAGTVAIALPGTAEVSSVADAVALVTSDARLVGVALLGALGGAFVAGNVAASLAPGDELPNALATGVLLVLIDVMTPAQFRLSIPPLWYTLGVVLLTIPASLFGGLRRRGPRYA